MTEPRGGKRPNSGRKPDPQKRQVLSCRVTPATLAALRERAVAAGVSVGAYIDRLLRDAI